MSQPKWWNPRPDRADLFIGVVVLGLIVWAVMFR